MPDSYATLLNPERALIFRIIHRANLPWVLDHGLHCGSSATRAAQWVSIGNQELISKRASWQVPVSPGGVLNDYVPFYFTPFSVMMRNINTGWNGVTHYANSDILILVSNLSLVSAMGLPFLFTDSHANNNLAGYWSELTDLDKVDWKLLHYFGAHFPQFAWIQSFDATLRADGHEDGRVDHAAGGGQATETGFGAWVSLKQFKHAVS